MPNIKLDPTAQENQELWQRWRDSRSYRDTEARSDIDFYSGNHILQMKVMTFLLLIKLQFQWIELAQQLKN